VRPGPGDPSKVLDQIPDLALVQEVWRQYGLCSSLTADNYFALVKDALSLIHIPNRFIDPKDSFVIGPERIKEAFVKINAGLIEEDIKIVCNQANLSEVQICVSKDLHFMSCPASPACQRSVVYVTARMPLAE